MTYTPRNSSARMFSTDTKEDEEDDASSSSSSSDSESSSSSSDSEGVAADELEAAAAEGKKVDDNLREGIVRLRDPSREPYDQEDAFMEDYNAADMKALRVKYKDLDFHRLKKTLDEADSRFFGSETAMWASPYHDPEQDLGNNAEKEADWNKDWDYQLDMFTGESDFVHVATGRTLSWRAGGSISRFKVMHFGGNGRGFIGYGVGKHDEIGTASDLSFRELKKNIIDVPLFENRTILSEVSAKMGSVTVTFSPRPRGYGIVAGNMMRELCICLGLQDICVTLVGTRNPFNVVIAAFKALAQVRSARSVAMGMGTNYYKMFEPGGHMERPPTTHELQQATRRISHTITKANRDWLVKKHHLKGANDWNKFAEKELKEEPGALTDMTYQEKLNALTYEPYPRHK